MENATMGKVLVTARLENLEDIYKTAQVADAFPVIIGQVLLELMDWVVDPKVRRLIGNPEHGGEQMIDVF